MKPLELSSDAIATLWYACWRAQQCDAGDIANSEYQRLYPEEYIESGKRQATLAALEKLIIDTDRMFIIPYQDHQ